MFSNTAATQHLKHVLRRGRNHCAGTVNAGDPGVVQKRVILRRNHASHHNGDVLMAEPAQFVDQFRHEGLVPRSQ